MNDPLEERLRRLRASALPDDMLTRLATPPPRTASRCLNIIRFSVAAAAAAAAIALMLRSEPPPDTDSTPVLADSSSRRVEDVRPLAVVSEGQRAWELVEVKWVDETTVVSAAGQSRAVQASNTHRTIVPVEIMLD